MTFKNKLEERLNIMAKKVYNSQDFKAFVVTGFLTNGRRFRSMTFGSGYSGWMHANGINLYKGRVWGVMACTGKRVLLKSVNC